MVDKSFQLLRTNVSLTTNIKIMVDGDYKLYLSSIESNSELSNTKYKHFSINKESFLEDKIPYFYDGLPKEQAFYVKYDNDNDIVYNDYDNQFDDIYFAGSKHVGDKWYKEEFEYFAPLYLRKNYLPDGFLILRVDDSGIFNESIKGYSIGSINKDNFINEIVDKWKCVKYFDLSTYSNLGYWLNRNINENERFPKSPFELDARKVNFSKWCGMDYETGVYTEKPMFLDEILGLNNPHYKLEKILTDGYRSNSIIFPNIINFSFLFDDNPATPDNFKKYSINRYYGFYVDQLQFITNITSYITPQLMSGTTLFNNIVISGTTGLTWDICDKDYDPYINSVNPFEETWDKNKDYYIYVKDDLHKVERFKDTNTGKWVYKLISEETLDSYWDTGQTYINTVDIERDDSYSYIVPKNSEFKVDSYLGCDGNINDMYGDLYIIKINDIFHVLKSGSGLTEQQLDYQNKNELINKYYIQSDYSILSDRNTLSYWIGGSNSEYYREISIENANRKPMVYSIYRIRFSDIKDFDFDRVSTNFSDFDYEKTEYVTTIEEKIYTDELLDVSIPKTKKREPFSTTNQYKIMNISSEYSASNELFDIGIDGGLSDIWRKNQSVCKWGFTGSISHSDYPYKLNTNIDIGSLYNRICDPFLTKPSIINKNLDHFYRIGNFYDNNYNDVYYLNQSTNIQTEYISNIDDNGYLQNMGRSFNVGIYFEKNVSSGYDFDYFNFFFNNKMIIEDSNMNYDKTYKKYATFSYGDDYSPSIALFKGIKYKIYDVNNIVRSDNGFIDSVITTTSSEYNEYKISVILSDVYYNDNSGTPYNINALVNYNDIVNIYNNGIHIIINKIYKNILVIINYAFALTGSTSDTINNVDLYGEKFGLYYSKNKNSSESRIGTYDPTILTTSNFINCLNNLNDKNGFDNYITYYYIEKNENNQTVTGSTIINGINNPSLPKILLRGEKPIPIKINRNSFGVETIKGPDYKNLYKNMTIGSSKILNEPLGRRLFKNYSLPIYETIYRFNGPYEPIFKDIELYKSASFCYTGYETGATYSTGVTYTANPKNSRDFSELKESIDWINTERLCSTDKYTYFVVYIAPGSMAHSVITNYLIMDNFNFGIPTNSEIEGIEVIIDRRSPAGYGDPPTDFYTKDYSVELKYKTELSNNKAKVNKWPTVYTEETYGGPTDTWGMTLNSVKLNNSDFGLKLSVEAFNSTSKPKYLSEVKCVTINVYTSVSGMTETYSNVTFFDENIKFDTSLRNFGEVSEFIYSKVNPYNESILRFKDNIYPIVDQFGYSYDDRFIFKSTWDYDFYYKTTDKFEDDNVKYDRPPINTTLLNMTLPNNPLSLD